MSTILETIKRRRSVKPVDMDASKQVSQDVWDRLFEAANWAPNHGHTEPWRFQVYAGDARENLARHLQLAYKTETPEAEFKPEKHANMGKNVMFSNSIVAIIMKRGDNPKVPEMEEIEAVACAVQNMHLLASSEDLGMYWSSPPATYGESFAKFLNLDEGDKCLGILFVGYMKDGKEWPKSVRKPVGEKIEYYS